MAGDNYPMHCNLPWFDYEPEFIIRNRESNLLAVIQDLEKRVTELEEAVVALNPILDTALMVMESVQRAAKRLKYKYG